MLSLEDQIACLVGYHTLINTQANTTYSWIYTDTVDYPAIYPMCRCGPHRKDILIDCFIPVPSVQGLDQWEDSWEPFFCKCCIREVKAAQQLGRQEIWDQLPTIFGLPVWDELLKERVGLCVFFDIHPFVLLILTALIQLNNIRSCLIYAPYNHSSFLSMASLHCLSPLCSLSC